MRRHLLETIAMMAGCKLISDLLYTQNPQWITSAVNALDVNDYPLDQWNDAAGYLTGTRVSFDDSQKAKEYLIRTPIVNKQSGMNL